MPSLTNPQATGVRWPLIVQGAVAPVTVGLALACRLALNPVMGHASPFMYFFIAILLSGWAGGLKAGLAATVLSDLAVTYFYMAPFMSFRVAGRMELIQILSFLVLGSVVSLIVSRLRLTLARAEQAMREAQASRQQMSGIVESAMDAIIGVDENQHIVLFNAAAEQMFGCSASAALGTPLDRFIPERFRAAHREHIRNFGATGQTARAMGALRPLGALRVNGEEFPIEASISQVAVGGQRIFTAILRDITERKRIHEELERRVAERTAQLQASYEQLAALNAKLEVSNRELQDFAFVASHDLQEPLRKVLAFGDCLLSEYREVLGETGADYLRRMQSAASRMQALISDLLQFSRVTSKAQPFAPVDLAGVAAGVLADMEVRLQQSGGRVEVGPLPVIEADSMQMRQLLQNLIGNAIKFARPGVPPLVRVYAEPAADDRDSLALVVADNGIGFEEKYVDRIFTVFQRLHERGAYEGTGIGLAICRKIVERHGGAITARSRPDEGATFIVSMPRKQTSRRDDDGS